MIECKQPSICESYESTYPSDLSFVHLPQGIIHTDLKPENVLFVEQLHRRQARERLHWTEVESRGKNKERVGEIGYRDRQRATAIREERCASGRERAARPIRLMAKLGKESRLSQPVCPV
jgi:serine/threonine protein kinase